MSAQPLRLYAHSVKYGFEHLDRMLSDRCFVVWLLPCHICVLTDPGI
jgi:hypothetical protein